MAAGRTTGPTLVFHFGMTGMLAWDEDGGRRHPHDRVVVVTDRGKLRYRDQRKLRGMWLAGDEAEMGRITGLLGPDALGRRDATWDEPSPARGGA